jgi:aminoglycoside phosphotransferase (APT) family kinase protein
VASGVADSATVDLTTVAAAVVADLMGTAIHTSERVHRGLMTFKCRVRTERGDDIMVRFYPSGRSSVVHYEPDLLVRCRQAGLPVPVTIGDSRTGPPAPLNYVAYFRIEGETLADRLPTLDQLQRQHLAADLASHLYHLQELTFKGAGDLESGTAGSDASWETFVRHSMYVGLDAIREHALLEPSLGSALERVVRAGPPASSRMTDRLVWGDINFENILVTERATVAGLIDFEGCLSGDPLATLGYCQAVHGPDPFFSMLLRAWPSSRTARDASVAWYALLRVLRLARYAHLALPTGLPRDPLIRIMPGIASAISTLDPEGQRSPLGRK